jgi:NADH-quinone oxidoreductase subunit A
MERSFIPDDYIPILIQSIVVLAFVVIVMLLTHYMTVKRRRIRTQSKEENFECGIEVKGNARFPFSVKYFLIAILFVLFDVEVIFFYPFAVNYKEMGVDGLIGMLIFTGGLLFGFFYLMKMGAFEWEK